MLSGCTGSIGNAVVTPLSTEFLPTAIALTLQAKGVNLSTSTSVPSQTKLVVPSISPTTLSTQPALTAATDIPLTTEFSQPVNATLAITQTLAPIDNATITPTLTVTGSIPFEIPLPPPPVDTSSPVIPESRIQINKLGELSLVTSPLQVPLHFTERIVRVVRIELFGENGRLLARHVRNFDDIPWGANQFTQNLEFEINAAAELSRLVVSVEDRFGRLTDVNSVNLILLSAGMAEINPASALWQRIIIQEPQSRGLVQGGKLIVSGRARPNSDQPLRVMLITENGKIIGQRLAGVTIQIPGDYGTFVTEVPYKVSDLVFALLVVYEEGEPISDIAHLSSTEVILAP